MVNLLLIFQINNLASQIFYSGKKHFAFSQLSSISFWKVDSQWANVMWLERPISVGNKNWWNQENYWYVGSRSKDHPKLQSRHLDTHMHMISLHLSLPLPSCQSLAASWRRPLLAERSPFRSFSGVHPARCQTQASLSTSLKTKGVTDAKWSQRGRGISLHSQARRDFEQVF